MRRSTAIGRWAALCGISALALGCRDSASIGELHWLPAADAVVEEGPLAEGPPQTVLGGTTEVFRVEGFAGTRLELTAAGGAATHLFVEGPLEDVEPPPGRAPIVGESQGPFARLNVELGLGVYRVVVGSDAGAPDVRFSSGCSAECTRETMAPSVLLDRLATEGDLELFVAQLEAKLGELIPDPMARAGLDARLESLVKARDFAGLARFPTLPLRAPSVLRPLAQLLADGSAAPAPDASVDGDLLALLGPCDAVRAPPAPLLPSDPLLGWGRFPDRTLTACQYAHSIRLAQILTALAAGGSSVTYQGQRYTTPSDLVAGLIASGHTVELSDERRYAGALALTYDRFDVRWPVWIDTGLPLLGPGGGEIVVPMGSSRHRFRITGPDVDARVAFSLGPAGAAFVPVIDEAPRWTGLKVRSSFSSASGGPQPILAALDAAARLVVRNRAERAQALGGFGWLGVANDANAVVEYFTEGAIGAFPLLRAAALDDAPPLGDGLDALLRTLPHDADRAPERRDDLSRLMAMSPFDPTSPDLPDDALRSELLQVNQEVLSY